MKYSTSGQTFTASGDAFDFSGPMLAIFKDGLRIYVPYVCI